MIKKTWRDDTRDLQGISIAMPRNSLWDLERTAERLGLNPSDAARTAIQEWLERQENAR